jgi:hypothetical protein
MRTLAWGSSVVLFRHEGFRGGKKTNQIIGIFEVPDSHISAIDALPLSPKHFEE